MTEKTVTVAFLAEMVGGRVVGDKNVLVRRFAPIDTAGCEDISFLAKAKMAELLETTGAGAVIVPPAPFGNPRLRISAILELTDFFSSGYIGNRQTLSSVVFEEWTRSRENSSLLVIKPV